jgi:hypothetical protein
MAEADARLTAEQVAAIQARCEQATSGPWCFDDHVVTPGDTPDQWHVYEALEDDPPLFSSDFGSKADADFIAHARQDVPDLLAALAQAERERDACKAETWELLAAIDKSQIGALEFHQFVALAKAHRTDSEIVDAVEAEKDRLTAALREAQQELGLTFAQLVRANLSRPREDAVKDVGAAAVAWYLAWREWNEIRRERDAHRCTEFEPRESDTDYPGVDVCYRQTDHEGQFIKVTDMCDECQAHDAAHQRMKLAARLRGAKLRSLKRVAAKFAQRNPMSREDATLDAARAARKEI